MSDLRISTTGFELHSWQQDAVDSWMSGYEGVAHTGTLEVVTGGGKTLIALSCLARASELEPQLRATVVVPTEALARQWIRSLVDKTSLSASEVGLLGAGGKATFESARVVVAVINTASKQLPDLARHAQPFMLIVDECHRAGAPQYRRVLDVPARFRLGLSATPDRDELDDEGEPLEYNEQVVGRALGGVVYHFSFKDARIHGWLPEFTLHHHAVSLSPDERREYDALSRRVDEAGDELRGRGFETGRARSLTTRRDETGDAARRWVQLTSQRKDLLYRAVERGRIAERVVRSLFSDSQQHRVILFHERVGEAVELFELLSKDLPVHAELEHSKLPGARRQQALSAFASGEAPILVSVKSLVEGIDVPEADTGISVASTSSVRQRVQALGRVLRRVVDAKTGVAKPSTMHLMYVTDTVDDFIYAKADWTDLTGEDSNRYWLWEYESDDPVEQFEPPRTPLPTEDSAWEQLGKRVPLGGTRWLGVPTGQEYSVKTTGAVHNAFGAQISNPQGVSEMVARVRGREGGKFRVTPEYRLVLVWQPGDDAAFMLVGQLADPFTPLDDAGIKTTFDVATLEPGDDYPGPGDKRGGTFKMSQRGGGLIEKRVSGGAVFALTVGVGDRGRLENARRVLEAWESRGRAFSRIFVNSSDHAWTEGPAGRVFVAQVPGGFEWPADGEG